MRSTVTAMFLCTLILSGCMNTTTFYDKDGNVIRVERNTDFTSAMQGTNQKTQFVLLSGRYIGLELSASVGESKMPGLETKYVSGKAAFVNARENSDFKGADKILKSFFAEKISAGKDGIVINSSAGVTMDSDKNNNQFNRGDKESEIQN